MMQEIAARLLEASLLGGAIVGLACTMVSGIYDLKQAARRPRLTKSLRALSRKTKQPSVTVLIYTYNDAKSIVGCLESLKNSRYHAFDVVVADNVSQDGTKKLVRTFMRKNPGFSVYLYAKRKRTAAQEAVRQAYGKSRRGELVVTLAATSRPSRLFLRESAARFLTEPDLSGVCVNEWRGVPLGIPDLVPEVFYAAKKMYLKIKSLTGKGGSLPTLGSVCRQALFLEQAKATTRYEGSLLLEVTERQSPQNSRKTFQGLKVLGVVTVILLMTYAMASAASLVSYVPLVMSWLLVVIGSLAIVWSDEGSKMMQKVQLTFSATILYFLVYVALLGFVLQQIARSTAVLPGVFRPVAIWRFTARSYVKMLSFF